MISVCLASYNGEKFIQEQIQSILSQLKISDELIISDDMSTDNTLEIIRSFQDERIQVFSHESSGRPTENFQNALQRAKGDIIFLADQDDIWIKGKVEIMIKALSKNILVLSDSLLVDENLKVLRKSFFEFHGSKKGIIRNIIKNSYFGSCMAFRKELLSYALPFPNTFEIGHDLWLGLVGEMVGNVTYVRESLIYYRRHSSTVTPHGIGHSKRSLIIKLWSRVVVLLFVVQFYFNYIINGKRISIHRYTDV